MYKCKVLDNFVTELNDGEIFVFGSNEGGRHGRGAAKIAQRFGAKYGVGDGIQGCSYGIPTKSSKLKILSVSKIKKYVDEFIDYVNNNFDKHFLITKIGCGLSRYSEKDIAPLFSKLINNTNVSLPKDFINFILKL